MVDHTALAPSLVISHEITEDSPLHGLTMEDIRAADGAIFVSVAATDDNHLQVTWQPSNVSSIQNLQQNFLWGLQMTALAHWQGKPEAWAYIL